MKFQNFLLALISFLLMGAKAAKPNISDEEKCRRWMIPRAQKMALEKAGQPWSELPKALSERPEATLLVNINLGYGTPTMTYLQDLTAPTGDLKIPESLKPHHKDNLALVVHGKRKALLDFYGRIARSPAFETTRFEIWPLSADQSPLSFPTHVVQLSEKASSQEQKEVERQISERLKNPNGFSVYNLSEDQTVFFLPRSFLQAESDSDFFAQQGIKTTWNRAVPISWSQWLIRKAEVFDGATIVFNRQWAILSASAFKKIYEVRRLGTDSLSDVGNIDENMKRVLSRCLGISCEVTPAQMQSAALDEAAEEASERVPASNEIPKAARTRIVKFFKAHRGHVNLTAEGGLRSIFIHLARLISDSKATDQYIKAIRSIRFGPSDYFAIAYNSPTTPALNHLEEGWRAFLRANRSSYADKRITARNVDLAIRSLPVGEEIQP